MWHVGRPMALSAFLLGAILLTSCGQENLDLSSLPEPVGIASVIESSEYPSVVKVIGPYGSGMCSGTFISPRVVLTAAHCTVDAADGATFTVITSFGIFTTTERQEGGPGVLNDPTDIALLIFSEDIADESLGQVSDVGSSVNSGDIVRLVGFGCNDLNSRSGAGVKRTGTNQIYNIGDYIDLYTPATTSSYGVRGIIGASNRAGSCFGDSGGPALRDNNGSLEVVGVAHAGGQSGDVILSEYVNVGSHSGNRHFLNQMNTLYSLNIQGI